MKGRTLGATSSSSARIAAASGGVEPEPAPQRIVMGQQALDLAVERVRFGKVHQADRAAADLVLVGGADAALGGADLDPFAGRRFPVRVELAMQREDQRGRFRRP